jgi:hypothetical protein
VEIKREEGISTLGKDKPEMVEESKSKCHKVFHWVVHVPLEVVCKMTIPVSDPKEWCKSIAVC